MSHPVSPLAPERLPDLPELAGVRFATAETGMRYKGRPDLLLAAFDAGTAVAGVFTQNKVCGHPVTWCRGILPRGTARALVVNAGNANVFRGAEGDAAVRTEAEAAARALNCDVQDVYVASTGVIGVPLPMDRVPGAILTARGQLSPDGDRAFWRAIATTDAFEKLLSLDVALPSGGVRLSAQAKGAGMIQPGFATMLCFVQTDAALSAETADLLLGVCVKRSFDRISVDGQLSTNDVALLMASGASGVIVEPESEDELRFGEALDYALRRLALQIVRDGEGAVRIGRVHVLGGDDTAVERVARAIANSPLVKAALYGGDPNWGRVAQAVGAALPGRPVPFDVSIDGVQVCAGGVAVPHEPPRLGEEVDYVVGLPGEGAETEVFFSDLSHDYVRINAEYTT
jgi:glutamate N-acetyltransferase/amino-acid N-acetyltransferase